MPGTIQNALNILSQILTALWGSYYYSHFTDEELDPERLSNNSHYFEWLATFPKNIYIS